MNAKSNVEQMCVFCEIAAGRRHAYLFWENQHHCSTLTQHPNTPGFTVVLTKSHLPSNIFDLSQIDLQGLIEAARSTAKILTARLKVGRVALIAEGMGVDHAHVKLVPLRGVVPGKPWTKIESKDQLFRVQYAGFISSQEGPKMDEAELQRMLRVLRDEDL